MVRQVERALLLRRERRALVFAESLAWDAGPRSAVAMGRACNVQQGTGRLGCHSRLQTLRTAPAPSSPVLPTNVDQGCARKGEPCKQSKMATSSGLQDHIRRGMSTVLGQANSAAASMLGTCTEFVSFLVRLVECSKKNLRRPSMRTPGGRVSARQSQTT